ncbi:hypothetical protein [Amycolatopsis aidingensis]|uniref:hypothetical protein n=1 Tax=Amycolatopsis aidingensis TaxID=2842453 RepID=UPI001C0B0752|nr:hypothetical protein [Amycolatopsis aidingensis]
MRLIAPALVAAALAAGCGGAPEGSPDAGAAAAESGVDVSVLRQGHHDFVPAPSPEALVRTGKHEVITAGKVDTVLQGEEIPLQEGDEQPELFVLLKVRVTETFRASSPEAINDGHVYVSVWQGPRYNDPAGTPEFSLADWNRAIPAGTPVMLFLNPADEGIRPGLPGVPAGARAMAADVQGILLEDGGRLLGGFEELEGQWTGIRSMTELADRVRKETR